MNEWMPSVQSSLYRIVSVQQMLALNTVLRGLSTLARGTQYMAGPSHPPSEPTRSATTLYCLSGK